MLEEPRSGAQGRIQQDLETVPHSEACKNQSEGFIVLTVLRAENLKAFQLFGKPSFYCEAALKYCSDDADKQTMDQARRTKDSSRPGSNPEWNEKLSFHYCAGFEPRILISIFKNENNSKDKAVGQAMIPLAASIRKGEERLILPVLKSKSRKLGGLLSVHVRFHRPSVEERASVEVGGGSFVKEKRLVERRGTWLGPHSGHMREAFSFNLADLLNQDADEVSEPKWKAQVLQKMSTYNTSPTIPLSGASKKQTSSPSYLRE